jgi:predicted RNA-binding Zn-ribbon protein involved in translation (DUF1610 family)
MSVLVENVEKTVQCPECGSRQVWLDGQRKASDDTPIQRYLCRGCGFRFSDPSRPRSQPNMLKVQDANIERHQICALEAKNLESPTEKETVAGDTQQPEMQILIQQYESYLQRENYYGDTVYKRHILTLIKDGADLYDPEDVKTKIATHKFTDKKGVEHEWKNGSKILAVYAYDAFCQMKEITWQRPVYTHDETVIECQKRKT